MVETSVVIPCWIVDNTLLQLTHRCVQAIRETSKVELILIDNGSSIWSDYLSSEADILVKFPENKGYTKAINSGFRLASNKYIVAGNNDCFVKGTWEQAMKDTMKLPLCGISFLQIEGNPVVDTYWVEHSTPGGWWMIERDTLDKVGLLDERFFNTYSDFDLVWRLKLKNIKVIGTSNSSVEHNGGMSLKRFTTHTRERSNGEILLFDKWEKEPRFAEFIKFIEGETA